MNNKIETIIQNQLNDFENETLKVIYERRAVRKYSEKPVSMELIDKLLRAGTMAPSALNLQPWKFYVLTQKKDILEFSREIAIASEEGIRKSGLQGALYHFMNDPHAKELFAGEDPVFHGAPVVVFLTSPKDNEWGPLDVAMCAQNIMLAAHAVGLGTCPIGFAKYVGLTNIYSRLAIPEPEHVNLAITIGYSKDNPVFHERKQDNRKFI